MVIQKEKGKVMKTNISCGAYIIYNKQILIVHATNNPIDVNWSIPKGLCNKNESPEDTMYREVYEETNIPLVEYRHTCIDLGMEKYKYRDKILHGFLVVLHEYNYPDIYCSSTYYDGGIIRPEVDGFLWEPIDNSLCIIHETQKSLYMKNKQIIDRYING